MSGRSIPPHRTSPAGGEGRVDLSAIRVNQVGIVVTVLAAFVASTVRPWAGLLIPLLAAVLLAGTWRDDLALFKNLYRGVLQPRGWVRAQIVGGNPAPHWFAQGLGGAVLLVASLLLLWRPLLGMALALLVAGLAFTNLAFGYCLGCQIYNVCTTPRRPRAT